MPNTAVGRQDHVAPSCTSPVAKANRVRRGPDEAFRVVFFLACQEEVEMCVFVMVVALGLLREFGGQIIVRRLLMFATSVVGPWTLFRVFLARILACTAVVCMHGGLDFAPNVQS